MGGKAAIVGVALTLVLAACGGDDDDSGAANDVATVPDASSTTEPAQTSTTAATTTAAPTTDATTTEAEAPETTTASTAPATTVGADGSAADSEFCGNLEQGITMSVAVTSPLMSEDSAALQAAVDEASGSVHDLAAALEATAPPELVDDVMVNANFLVGFVDALAAIDVTDEAAIEAVLEEHSPFDPELSAAGESTSAYAEDVCGFDGDELVAEQVEFPESPEPPDACEFVDPEVPAAVAGITIDDAEPRAQGDVDLGMFRVKGCAYDRGEITLNTVGLGSSLDVVVQSWIESFENQDSVVVPDVDLGSLPASTFVVDADGAGQIVVLEAPTPFTLFFQDIADPDVLVAAAEAIVAATS